MTLRESPYADAILDRFDAPFDFEFLNLVARVLQSMDDGLDAQDAIGSETIYDDDKWLALKRYCRPEDANWERACEAFAEDLEEIRRAYEEAAL